MSGTRARWSIGVSERSARQWQTRTGHERAGRRRVVLLAHLSSKVRGDVTEHATEGAVGRVCHQGTALTLDATHAQVQRYGPEEGKLVAFRERASPAAAEDIGALTAVRADETAHVLHDTEHRNVELAEHLDAAAHIRERHILRSRADDSAGHRHALRQAQLHIARARR